MISTLLSLLHDALITSRAKAETSSYQVNGQPVVILPRAEFIAWLTMLIKWVDILGGNNTEDGNGTTAK